MRAHDLQIRNPLLYLAELPDRLTVSPTAKLPRRQGKIKTGGLRLTQSFVRDFALRLEAGGESCTRDIRVGGPTFCY